MSSLREKVESALYFEQNLNVLKDSVEKKLRTNSMQQRKILLLVKKNLQGTLLCSGLGYSRVCLSL